MFVRPIPLPMLPPGVMRPIFDPMELLPMLVRPIVLPMLEPGVMPLPAAVFCPKLRDIDEPALEPPSWPPPLRFAESWEPDRELTPL